MNRLGECTSPYLLAHADDPIDWWPWCAEAFDEARRRDLPVMVSIGYDSCHWCHRMHEDTFVHADVGDALRRDFVAIKVDREEHPDVDATHMAAVVALTGGGGWPLTTMCDADGAVFWAGTYYDHDRILGLLDAVVGVWRDRRDEVAANSASVRDAIISNSPASTAAPSPAAADLTVVDNTLAAIATGYDRDYGGFGRGAKFPATPLIDLVLRAHMASGGGDAAEVVTTTLDAIDTGALFDPMTCTWARYCTDREWQRPHFERGLGDQAALIRTHLRAWSALGHRRYGLVATAAIDALLTTWRANGGGYIAGIDADGPSGDGIVREGGHLTLSRDDVHTACGADADDVMNLLGLGDPRREIDQRWAPVLSDADHLDDDRVRRARRAVLTMRQQWPQPRRDHTVVTATNARWCATLADAARLSGRSDWAEAAHELATTLDTTHRYGDHWFRLRRGDTPALDATAHDLIALADAFTRTGEMAGGGHWHQRARHVLEYTLDHFWDADNGGVFTRPADTVGPVINRCEFIDDADMSTNSLAALTMVRMASLHDEQRWAHMADRILAQITARAVDNPTSVAAGVAVIDTRYRGVTEVVVVGDDTDLQRAAHRIDRPDLVHLWGEPWPTPLWDYRANGPNAVHICHGGVCDLPVTTAADVIRRLSNA